MARYQAFDEAVKEFTLIEQAYNNGDMRKRYMKLRQDARTLSAENPLRFKATSDRMFEVHIVLSGKELGTLTVEYDLDSRWISMRVESKGELTEIKIAETSQELLFATVEENPFGIENDFLDDFYLQYVLSCLLEYVTHHLAQTKVEVEQ